MERAESIHHSFTLSPEDVLLSIESDPFLSPFCKDNFDRVAFAGGIISTCGGGFSSSLLNTGKGEKRAKLVLLLNIFWKCQSCCLM